jgi:hypothetical protein
MGERVKHFFLENIFRNFEKLFGLKYGNIGVKE